MSQRAHINGGSGCLRVHVMSSPTLGEGTKKMILMEGHDSSRGSALGTNEASMTKRQIKSAEGGRTTTVRGYLHFR